MMIETFNAWSLSWSAWMITAFVEGTALFMFASATWFFVGRRASAQFGYLLFLLVLARLVLPATIAVPERWAWLSPDYAIGQAGSWLPFADYRSAKRRWRSTAETGDPLDREIRAEAFASHTDLLRVEKQTTVRLKQSEQAESLSLAGASMILWTVIVAALMARLAWVHINWQRRLADARAIGHSELPLEFATLLKCLRIRRRVKIIESAAVGSPAVSGLLRPRLVVPPGLTERLPRDKLAWVLAHELAHVRRGDIWVVLAQRCLQIVYFFHPAVWLANRMIDRQREYACDDLARAASGGRGRDCADALVSMAEWACRRPPQPALGLFASPSLLKLRVRRLIAAQSPASQQLSPVSLALLLVAALVLLPHIRAAEPSTGRQRLQKAAAQQDAGNKWAAAKPQFPQAKAQVQAQPATEKAMTPSLESRAAAIEAIRRAGGRLEPDREQLLAWLVADQHWRLNDPKSEFVVARFVPGKAVDDALAALAQFPELRTIHLSGTQVTEAGLTHVGRLKALITLSLESTPTTDVGLSRLVGLKKLQRLELSKTKVTGRGMQWLAQLKDLESLGLNDTAVGDEGLESLAALEQLQIVELKNTQVTDAGLAFLADASHLRGLWLGGDQITDAGLSHLRRLADLEWLDLTGAAISDVALQQLDPQRKLKLLYLRDSLIGDASADWLGQRAGLTELDLSNTALTDAGLAKLAGLNQLEYLNLSGAQITDDGLKALTGCDKLKVLHLANTAVTDAGMADVSRLNALENLNLSGTRTTASGLEPLKALPRLTKLVVKDTALTELDVYLALPQLSPSVQKLLAALNDHTELEFQDQPLSDVMEYLKERHGIEIYLDIKSLRATGKSSVSPMSIKLKGISLREALKQLLEKYGLAMAIRHEVLMIGSKPLPKEFPAIPILPAGEQLPQKLREALGEKTEFRFIDQPLSDVLEDLSERHNIEIILDNAALTKAGIGSDTPILIYLKGTMLKSGLELLLGEIGLTCFAEKERLIVRPIP